MCKEREQQSHIQCWKALHIDYRKPLLLPAGSYLKFIHSVAKRSLKTSNPLVSLHKEIILPGICIKDSSLARPTSMQLWVFGLSDVITEYAVSPKRTINVRQCGNNNNKGLIECWIQLLGVFRPSLNPDR